MAEDWRDRAVCQQTDPEAFFPEKGGDNGAAAKAICADCPVRLDCEDYALRTDQRYGIWAGYSPKELRALRSKRGIVVEKYPVEKILSYHKLGWSARAIGTALRLHPDVVRREIRQAEGRVAGEVAA